jgi:parallel beta-helix repeat protein
MKGIYGRTENSRTPKEDSESNFQTFSSFTLQYDTHSPIYIEGNADFKTQASIENWPGNGTQSAPYVIDRLAIIDTSNHWGKRMVEIKDSDAHFRISNCLLDHGITGMYSTTGILLRNASNGQLTNNTIANHGYGIELNSSGNNILTNNTVANNSRYGIGLEFSRNNTLTNNTVANNYKYGIGLEFSRNNTLTNNTVTNNRDGIRFEFSRNNTLVGNTVANNEGGVILDSSGNNMILENNLTNNALFIIGSGLEDYLQVGVSNNSVNGRPLVYWQNITSGIVQSGTGQVILVNSDFVEVTGQNLLSLQAFYCSNLFIHNNIIANNSREGIQLISSGNNTLTNNTVANNNRYGIGLEFSRNNTLTNNTVANNSWDGIRLFSSGNNTLVGNTIANNSRDGIYLLSSGSITLTNNTVTNNERGIFLYSSGNNTLVGNTVANNSWDGIRLFSSWNNILIGNTVATNGWVGIFLYSSGNNTLVGNTVANNNGFGLGLDFSENNTLVGNTVANNDWVGIFIYRLSYNIGVRYNDFSGNNAGSFQAYDDGSSNIFAFNFWDDWISPDIDADGVVDTPYPIEGDAYNQDPYPRVFPQNHVFSHLLVRPRIIFPNGGENLSGKVLVSWIPALDSQGHSISYSIYYSVDDENTWILLGSQLLDTEFLWDLRSLAGKTCMIKVVATCSEGLSAFDVSDDPIYIIMPATTSLQVSQPIGLFFIIFIMGFKRRKRKSMIFANAIN